MVNENEEKDKAVEAEVQDQKEFTFFSVRMVPKKTFLEFKAWCREHAGNKFSTGLQVLLDIAKQTEMNAALFGKMNELEERMKIFEGVEAKPSFPKTLGSKKEEVNEDE